MCLSRSIKRESERFRPGKYLQSALLVPLGVGELVVSTVSPDLEEIFALHSEAVDTGSMTVRPAQASKDVGLLDRVAPVGVGAVLAAAADGNIRIIGS